MPWVWVMCHCSAGLGRAAVGVPAAAAIPVAGLGVAVRRGEPRFYDCHSAGQQLDITPYCPIVLK